MESKFILAGEIIETFGRQIGVASEQEAKYNDNPEELSLIWPELKGNERRILDLAHQVRVRERISLAHMYGWEIGKTLETIAEDKWSELTDPNYQFYTDDDD